MAKVGFGRGAWLVLAGAISLAGVGCGLIDDPMRRTGTIQVVMNPDSTQFAYALDYHRGPGLIPLPPPGARVEIWTYDLSRRTGPRRIGGWSHDWKVDARILLWTAEGLWLAYSREGQSSSNELVDPKSGRRSSIYPPPVEDLRIGSPNRDVLRHTRHVELRHGEFGLWDPATLKLVPLFALPVDSSELQSNARYELHSREVERRQDGVQAIDRVEAARSANGLLVRIRTYARRTAPFARQYRLQFEITAPKRGRYPNETIVGPVAMWDTMVTPAPGGDVLAVNLPHTRFRKALRPSRDLPGEHPAWYMGNLVTTLVPDSLAGDADVSPGILDGSVSWNWTWIEVPLP